MVTIVYIALHYFITYLRYFVLGFCVTIISILFSWSHGIPTKKIYEYRSVLPISYGNEILTKYRINLTQKDHLPLTIRNISLILPSVKLKIAVVTAIYNDPYVNGVRVLGYSLKKFRTNADLILTYIPGRVSNATLEKCEEMGWHLMPVDRIPPPTFAIVYPRFKDQFTKLRIWSMTDYDRILYLDGDTLVVSDINELFRLTAKNDWEGFLSVLDTWQGQIGPNFNAGVLLIKPNITLFNEMMNKIHMMPQYGTYWAEQGFLNCTGRLPLTYNFNSVLALYHKDIYNQLNKSKKIIHYTAFKPFTIKDVNEIDSVYVDLWKEWKQMEEEMNENVKLNNTDSAS
ncbi:unnamed protein product [Didymodactylos carnosus]|uniref:glycogenin glucosyltransferase n=1 Tax=Didymodactylos carnosus TaxID=1234261 RepID=A0A814G3J9_9BILA|nr:unnamed protein product [Didymodactylos carnosus]CAF1341797.1 unnamed protein product [Didymodactylos carnosus]CAF3760600.1 unnamed protein product [Didymodactylos carnosus]CAF4152904.1 unnamed protein product [Didymodactylos carnosus]